MLWPGLFGPLVVVHYRYNDETAEMDQAGMMDAGHDHPHRWERALRASPWMDWQPMVWFLLVGLLLCNVVAALQPCPDVTDCTAARWSAPMLPIMLLDPCTPDIKHADVPAPSLPSPHLCPHGLGQVLLMRPLLLLTAVSILAVLHLGQPPVRQSLSHPPSAPPPQPVFG